MNLKISFLLHSKSLLIHPYFTVLKLIMSVNITVLVVLGLGKITNIVQKTILEIVVSIVRIETLED